MKKGKKWSEEKRGWKMRVPSMGAPQNEREGKGASAKVKFFRNPLLIIVFHDSNIPTSCHSSTNYLSSFLWIIVWVAFPL